MNVIDEVKAKTKKLIEMKKEYNDSVTSVDNEFNDKKELLQQMNIHISIPLARKCIEALHKSPLNAPKVAQLLKQLRDEEIATSSESYLEEEEEEELISNAGTVPNIDVSSSDDTLDENSIHLDDEKFFGQFNQNSDPLE